MRNSPKNRNALPTSIRRNPTTRAALSAHCSLLLALAVAAEGHGPTIAGVLGITPQAACARLKRRSIRDHWLALRRARRVTELRASWRRSWWRGRLRAFGLVPALIPVDDPIWPYCWHRGRGALVRLAAAELRAEEPGSLAPDHRIEALLERVAELAALDEVSRAHRFAALSIV